MPSLKIAKAGREPGQLKYRHPLAKPRKQLDGQWKGREAALQLLGRKMGPNQGCTLGV